MAIAAECWEWPGYVDPTGYGRVHLRGIPYLVHRHVWSMANGAIPKGMVVHHECENTLCFNPAHLRAMTRGDHIRHHRKHEACPRCGSYDRIFNKRSDGRANGSKCRPCHNKRMRERRAACP